MPSPEQIAVEPVRGVGVALRGDQNFFAIVPEDEAKGLYEKASILCWDVRRLHDWPLTDEREVLDVRLMLGGDGTLAREAGRRAEKQGADPRWRRLCDLEDRMSGHARALQLTGISQPASLAAPRGLVREWALARAWAIHELGKTTPLDPELVDRWPFIRALREIERNGIAVDLPRVQALLRSGATEPAHRAALRALEGLWRDGFVYSLYNPIGTKTGRLRHEGGFNALGIPHGPVRECLLSRHEGGQVVSLDFNAIDYRCIVNSVGGETAALYQGSRDFHARTASFIFKEVKPYLRDAVKYVSYIYIYGGSVETLQAKTGWTKEQVETVLDRLDERVGPIKEFRERLWMQAQESGYVQVPGGHRVPVESDASPGKVIGLYAQSYSSWVFERAVVRAQQMLRDRESKVIFMVHDELVIDVHPTDNTIIDSMRATMESYGHSVSVERGPNYGQLKPD